VNTGRLIGIILVIVGLGIALLAGLFIATQISSSAMSGGGAVVTAGIAFIPIALFVGFGIFMFIRGGAEAEEESTMQKQRQLLDIVKSRGQVSVSDLSLEMKVNADTLKNMIHQLVGLQVFSGYVNWDKGVLYSAEASKLRDLKQCENCGGEIQLTGKGVVKCRFCGTEYFLS